MEITKVGESQYQFQGHTLTMTEENLEGFKLAHQLLEGSLTNRGLDLKTPQIAAGYVFYLSTVGPSDRMTLWAAAQHHYENLLAIHPLVEAMICRPGYPNTPYDYSQLPENLK